MQRLINVEGRDRSKLDTVKDILALDDGVIDELLQDPTARKLPGIDVKHIDVLRLYVLAEASVVRIQNVEWYNCC